MTISQAQGASLAGASHVDVADFIDRQSVGGFQIKLLLHPEIWIVMAILTWFCADPVASCGSCATTVAIAPTLWP